MSGAAQKAKVAGCAHFPLADMRVTVLEVEGTVQLVCAREWDQGRFNTMFNAFAAGATAGELRAIADHLDQIGVPA